MQGKRNMTLAAIGRAGTLVHALTGDAAARRAQACPPYGLAVLKFNRDLSFCD
jgi:hypothetical protein